MNRILVGVEATLYETITTGEADAGVDGATVTIRRADGTTVVDAAPAFAISPDDPTVFVTLPAGAVDRLDRLTVQWSFYLEGVAQQLTSYVEVVGGFLCSLVELRGMDPLANTTKYPLGELLEKRTLAETLLEDACGRAFVPRYQVETRRMRRGRIFTSMPDVRAVRSIARTGVNAWTASPADLAAMAVHDDGFHITSGWGGGTDRVTVGYEHGMDYPPADVKRAALQLARFFLVEGPTDPRVITQTGDYGSSTLWTPGVRGAITPLPEVDAVIRRYQTPAVA